MRDIITKLEELNVEKQQLDEGHMSDMAHEAEKDHEVQMARSDLYKAAKYAVSIHKMMKDVSEMQGIDGWVASKITKASDYLGSVKHYMEGQAMQDVELAVVPVAGDMTDAMTLPEGFAVGANVAPAEEGPDQAPGKVIAVDGDKVTVKFMDGSTEVFAQDELFALPTGLKMGEGVTEGRMSMKQLASMDKDAARKIEAMVGDESKYADMGDYQEALYNAAKRMGLVESVQINEGEVENAELVLAAKDMVDRVQGMLEDIGKMINEDLPPLTDAIRDEMDSTVADSFNSSMSTALNSLLDNLGTARTGVDEASRVLVGDTPAEPMGAEEPGEVTAPDAEPEDDFGASDPAVGGEEPMGRELAGGEEEETDVFGEPA